MSAGAVEAAAGCPSVYAYHLLRSALAAFGQGPGALDAAQLDTVRAQAKHTFRLEERVLASPEARAVTLPRERVEQAAAEVAARYPDRAAYLDDLAANGLDEAVLREALRRELVFDAVMSQVGACTGPVTETDIRLLYKLHMDRFAVPERRGARHLLITINPAYPGNGPAAAHTRIGQIQRRLQRSPERFAEEAAQHSECPSALQGGLLGEIARGTLYPELEAALFALRAGEISGVVQTEMGLHLVRCEAIRLARTVPLAKAAPGIRRMLEQRQRRACQRAWLAGLQASAQG